MRRGPIRLRPGRGQPAGVPDSAAGFTLLELLVALTVLGVLTALLSSGMGFGARVWERQRNQLAAQAETQTMQDVIRRLLTQAWPLGGTLAGSSQASSLLGSDSSIQFFGPPPAQSLAGGIYSYTIQVRANPQGTNRLVLLWRRRSPDGTNRAEPPTNAPLDTEGRLRVGKEVVLIDGIAAVRFSFFGKEEDGSGGRWRDRWQDSEKLPVLVRLDVTFPQGDPRTWPPLVVAPRITGSLSEG